MMTNQLEIKELFVSFEKSKEEEQRFFEYFVDGLELSRLLKINRFSLAYCGVDLDLISRKDEIGVTLFQQYIASFLGQDIAQNQISPGRPVLYRCHCGSDYCGNISFDLDIVKDTVFWRGIRYEGDEDDNEGLGINDFEFNKLEYELVFENFQKYTGNHPVAEPGSLK